MIAGRKYTERDAKSGETKEFIHLQSIAQLESQLKLTEAALAAAVDPDVSLSSANPMQVVSPGIGNMFERQGIRKRSRADVSHPGKEPRIHP